MTSPTPRRVLRYEVPVDDRWHEIDYTGEICKIGSRKPAVVEFWTLPPMIRRATTDGLGELLAVSYDDAPPAPASHGWFRVYGTGMIVEGIYVGTTYDGEYTPLVWHLFRRETAPQMIS